MLGIGQIFTRCGSEIEVIHFVLITLMLVYSPRGISGCALVHHIMNCILWAVKRASPGLWSGQGLLLTLFEQSAGVTN
jgi:hypothetical protein